MFRTIITDDIWFRIASILKTYRIYFYNEIRLFVEAVLWKLRTGAPLRDLPTEFGSHSTVFNKKTDGLNLDFGKKFLIKLKARLTTNGIL